MASYIYWHAIIFLSHMPCHIIILYVGNYFIIHCTTFLSLEFKETMQIIFLVNLMQTKMILISTHYKYKNFYIINSLKIKKINNHIIHYNFHYYIIFYFSPASSLNLIQHMMDLLFTQIYVIGWFYHTTNHVPLLS